MDLILTSLLGAVLILATFVWGLRHALKGSVPVKGKTNIPGPGYTLPFIGDAWRFAFVRNMKDLLEVAESVSNVADKALSLWMGPKLMVLVKDAKMGEVIMNSSKAVNKDTDVYKGFNHFADGLFSRNGKGWRDLRRPLNRMLQPVNIMEKYYDVFTAKSEELCGVFEDKCGKGAFDILKCMQDTMLDIVFETLLGVPPESKSEGRFDLTLISRMVSLCMQLAMNPLYKFQSLMLSSPLLKEMKSIKSETHIWGKRLHETRMKILEENSVNPNDPDFETEYFMDVAIQLTNSEARSDQYRALSKPIDLIVAGFDTSSVALSSTILFLAMHPEYQERAYQEQIVIMGNTLRAPTEDEIAKMDYLWMAFQETLRHVGPAGVFRLITSELVIDNYIFPEGTSAYLSIRNFNMNPEHWEKPKDFYPDHFLPENVAKRPKAAWQPFSSGARSCPGKAFAHVSSKIILSMLLRRFKFTTALNYSEMEYEYMLMLESVKGYPVKVERRSVSAAYEEYRKG